MDEVVNSLFEPLVKLLSGFLFWDPFKAFGVDIGFRFPLVVMWLMIWGVYFTFRMGFINIRGFKLSLLITSGKLDRNSNKGEVSHFQALSTALSATVGLGNIAGVAIAISLGGPGATFWMIMAGLLGMSLKFTECTLGQKYRVIDSNGRVSGGPMYYLSQGLAKRNMKIFGKILAVIFSVLVIGASFGGGNMFQSNQAFSQMSYIIPWLNGKGFYFGIVLAILVGLVVLGGIKSIARVASRIVPFMVVLYISTSLIIIFMNLDRVGEVFRMIVEQAFGLKPIAGGFFGAFIIGFQRGAFSNEAGIGSASIAHSAARTDEPVSEGIVALLEPFIDTVVVCTMTALVINFSGLANQQTNLQGAQLTSAAFATVLPWYPYLLAIAILLFAFSTMISWSYYGLKGFNYLFEKPLSKLFPIPNLSTKVYYVFFLLFIVIGSASNLWAVMDFSDMMILGMAFPNILGMIFLASEVRADLDNFWNRWKRNNNPDNA
ncbi:MAG: alanine or glycine:cation symporter, family [Tenuifilum sp.]|jgi:AGCS family alanine or glycine:cation symporter|uniref:alanine/glycine:cation symporter family protein n=1 Tax=Tenuifilum sp. TaxID=2760880 RepID=UPI0024AC57C8|nr:alanine/glycine:cation symporter family protein [Tenuifilum sp.]MDI3525839.1 alanine or glycine:cation symporter, family [Tenuifilum sp.]